MMPHRAGLAVLLAAALAAGLWQTARWTREAGIAEARTAAHTALERYAGNLKSLLETYEVLPRILARDALIERLLARPDDAELRERVNHHLAEFNRASRASVTYVMDVSGEALVASNAESDVPFVGRNFAFRPYFGEALAGRAGLYFALGTTSNLPGFYFSAPVEHDDAVRGVAAVKISQERLEAAWSQASNPVFVTDAEGVIFVTNREDLRYLSRRPLSPAARERLIESRQYGERPPLAALPVLAAAADPAPRLRLSERVAAAGRTPHTRIVDYLVESAPVPGTPWTVHVLTPLAPIEARVWTAVLLVGSAGAVALLLGLFLRQRRLRARERLLYQAQVAETLRRARDELELRVAERTRDLSSTNARLQQEIGERERAEQRLLKTRDELVQASKLAALGQMSAGIVHELNQPLAAIQAYAANAGTFLERGLPGRARDNLALIGELTERMALLTGELKTFARRTSDEVVAIAPLPAARAALALLAPRLRKDGVALAVDLPATAPRVHGNTIRLEQVLVNLLKNACDALNGSLAPRLELAAREDGEWFVFAVRDNGPGIPCEALPQLFDPFFTTKPVGEGLGLGLSISYGIVKHFGGEIRAANRPDGGAEFTVRLKREA